jgi:hypothetical protein
MILTLPRTGCQTCIQGLRYCLSQPIGTIQARSSETIYRIEGTVTQHLPSYPSWEDEILSTWEERNTVFLSQVRYYRWRKIDCGKVLPSKFATITREIES